MNERYKIELCSDLDYEGMVAFISWDDKPFATLSCDGGFDKMEIEISMSDDDQHINIPYNDFIEAFSFAKSTLVNSCQEK